MFKTGTYEVPQSGQIESLLYGTLGFLDTIMVNDIVMARGNMFGRPDRVRINVKSGDIVIYHVSYFTVIHFTPFYGGKYSETLKIIIS